MATTSATAVVGSGFQIDSASGCKRPIGFNNGSIGPVNHNGIDRFDCPKSEVGDRFHGTSKA
jgi:hypothetical protein